MEGIKECFLKIAATNNFDTALSIIFIIALYFLLKLIRDPS